MFVYLSLGILLMVAQSTENQHGHYARIHEVFHILLFPNLMVTCKETEAQCYESAEPSHYPQVS